MRIKKVLASAAALAVAGAIVAAPESASALTFRHMVGFAGGSAVKALGSTVESDLTSQAAVDTIHPGDSQFNTLATATVLNLAKVGAITTSVVTAPTTDGGVQVTSTAQTANVSLLNGLITVQAITTVDVATVHGDNTTSSAINTQVLGLKVGNAHIPVPIPQNFHVTIPGIVNVVLNAAFSVGDNTTGSLMTEGAGFYISLLKGVGTSPVGTEVFINPVYAAIATVSPQTGPVVGGNAYGSQITVVAGKLLNIYSGPTAQVGIPPYGTNGVTITNTTATATIPSILTLGVLTDKANGLKGPTGGFSQATTQTSLAHLNLLGGLITADALTGTAHVETTANGTSTVASTSTSIVNLVIAGHAIPVNVAPNTVINLASLGQITIRKQVQSANTAAVTLLEIKVTVAQGNIPVGALIQIGYASAEVFIP